MADGYTRREREQVTEQDGAPPGDRDWWAAHTFLAAGETLEVVPDVIVLPVCEASVRYARSWMAKIASEVWKMDDYIPRLAISELATNAIRHSALDRQIVARAYIRGGKHILELWDQCPALPEARQADPDEEGGRGLFLLARLVARWGVRPLSPPEAGKIVYVEFD